MSCRLQTHILYTQGLSTVCPEMLAISCFFLPSFSFSLYQTIVLPYWTPTWCHKRHFTAHLWIEMCIGCQIHKAPWSVRWGAWGEFRPLDYPTSPPTAPKCHVKDWELFSLHHHEHRSGLKKCGKCQWVLFWSGSWRNRKVRRKSWIQKENSKQLHTNT